MPKINITKIRLYLLLALIIFLPFSAWLVSLTGRPEISTIRDFLVIGLFCVSLVAFNKEKFKKPLPILIILYIIYILLSYFWAEASSLQWLRGAKFSITPMLLLLTLITSNLDKTEIKIVVKAIIGGSLIVLFFAALEFFGIKSPTLSALSGAGELNSFHFVGATSISRLQSILAGPNALGLYLLTIIAYSIGWGEEIKYSKWLIALSSIILILTFSRSAWIGLAILALVFIVQKYKPKAVQLSYIVILLAIVIGSVFFISKKSQTVSQLFSHGFSTDMRFEQYDRIWTEIYDIGLLGRGAGAAGPSTQNRLDNGPNYWTENTYLDTFEEFGLVGVILFLSILSFSFLKILKSQKDNSKTTALLLLPSFMIAGIFINFFTGQVGLFLIIIAVGLVSEQSAHKLEEAK